MSKIGAGSLMHARKKSKGLSIVIPTYNEKESIGILIKKIEGAMQSAKTEYEIIVVDDNSPDKTWQLVGKSAWKNSKIKVIRRMNERGLSTAVLAGFDSAKYNVLAAMDADLSHDPAVLPKMLKKILQGNEFVVGKRRKIIGWPWYRKIISWGAALPVRLILKTPLADPMSGYFMLSNDFYEKYKQVIKINNDKPSGFKILLDIAAKARPEKISEVEFTFMQRKAGKSKLSAKVAFEYIKMLVQLSRFIKFCLVGASGVIVNIGLLWILTESLRLFYLHSAAIAIETSILTNFALNERWTWSDKSSKSPGKSSVLSRAAKFNLFSLGGLVINMTVLWMLTHFFSVYYIFSALAGIAVATFWNYKVNKHWTW
jgi:dolichol-phosphate mannosyltransferase